MDHAQGFLNLVNDAKQRIKQETFRETKKRMDNGDKLILVDTREDAEWARGHIPGAIHLGRGIIERDIEKTIPDKDTPIVLYCGGGFRSRRRPIISENGLPQCDLNGRRLRGWFEAGFPIIKD